MSLEFATIALWPARGVLSFPAKDQDQKFFVSNLAIDGIFVLDASSIDFQ